MLLYQQGEDNESDLYPDLKSLVDAKMVEGQNNGMKTALLFPSDKTFFCLCI